MGKVRIKLQCMNGGGLSPGKETVHYLSDHEETTTTFILQHESEGVQITHNLDDYDRDELDVLAALTKRKAATTKVKA